jgi:hypothetical protein
MPSQHRTRFGSGVIGFVVDNLSEPSCFWCPATVALGGLFSSVWAYLVLQNGGPALSLPPMSPAQAFSTGFSGYSLQGSRHFEPDYGNQEFEQDLD